MTDKDHPEKKDPPKVDIWLPRWGAENAFFDNSMLNREKVTFRDGSKLVVYEENQDIGDYLIELQQDAEQTPLPNPRHDIFRSWYYSKLVACSAGDVPTCDQARALPAVELNKWIEAVRKVNPGWWQNLDKALSEMTAEEKKRKPKRPRK